MGLERTEELSLNMGPQHPSMHGVFRMVVTFDGEVITKIEPKVGYLHRGLEKLAESRTYTQFIPYTDRLDYLSAPHNNMAYVQTVEKLMGVQLPERAEYLRVIFAELARIASHLVFIASTALDMAGWTAWTYCFRDRERILDLFEMSAGSRLTVNAMRIGGFNRDVPPEFWPALKSFLDDLPEMMEEYFGIFYGNEIVMARLKSVGILPKELAENLSITGPVLRASGVQYDVRKAEPYGIYDRFDFEVPVRYGCDSYDRTLLRLDEIRESGKILRQAMRDIPEGPVTAKVSKIIKPPAGEVYHRVENPKGELGFYIVSDGSPKPARVRIRSGTFINIQMLPIVALGWKIQDLIAIFATLDAVLGEVDK
ncbi:NAD(P)H-quinone oxidoreductase subunit D/H [Acididesulfobacillus acetoxydans]|uniref:NADH-quinone oxidoreductase subunit D n=1 Tax=Acididesulfobacillus acetoxydans TaxID=1561005 RepID=A0A8S0X0P8_9FIRM|nr:NADH-quinone oxidoreductase subunit D [Acididesulfobacillus acetoxydans]CAA7602701.1 NAD(P)H-quinone oxidoreductase subunit D/H [Acididesulfobacillus acetoxydans]CEJ06442.1 NADH-quinone oxidoreductase subunit D [Acididesulfobacillus acetoxydans]